MGFVKATKKQAKLRLNLNGPAGAGKTYSALAIASELGTKVALIDTERGSASKYADKFSFDVQEVFDDYHPNRVMAALDEAKGYDVVIVDSLSHFWNGKGGFLDLVDQEVQDMKNRGNKPDSFAAWKKITPIYNKLIQKLLGFPGHLICTARAKMDYDKQQDDRGKTKVVKIGLAPELRDGWQYEFDVEGMMTEDNVLLIGKTRCPDLKGRTFKEPGADIAKILKAWLEDGEVQTFEPSGETTTIGAIAQPGESETQRRLREAVINCRTAAQLDEIMVKLSRASAELQKWSEPLIAEKEAALKLKDAA